MNNGNGKHLATQADSGLHVAIIMDGSGRWAVARGLPRAEGHRAGRAAVARTVEAALRRDVRVLTLFSFSTDNWGRPPHEVAELMCTFETFFRADGRALSRDGVRVTAVGRRDRLPLSLREAIEEAEAANAASSPLNLRLAIDYSGREAILAAARRFYLAADDGEEGFSHLLTESDHSVETAPDVDLLIRTGGELRLSNCPLWEIAYAELYFTPCLWPDFGAAEFDAALDEFGRRDRRFGRIPVVA